MEKQEINPACPVDPQLHECAFKGKNGTYKNVAHQNGLSFLPIIFESTGRLHPSAVQFFRSVAQFAEEPLKIPKATLYGYMMKRLSCTLQRGIANSILSRISAIKGHQSRVMRKSYTHSHDFVSTHHRIRAVGGRQGKRD